MYRSKRSALVLTLGLALFLAGSSSARAEDHLADEAKEQSERAWDRTQDGVKKGYEAIPSQFGANSL